MKIKPNNLIFPEWKRQPYESAEVYEYFLTYLSIGKKDYTETVNIYCDKLKIRRKLIFRRINTAYHRWQWEIRIQKYNELKQINEHPTNTEMKNNKPNLSAPEWLIQPGESPLEYEYFTIYLLMGKTRSIDKTAGCFNRYFRSKAYNRLSIISREWSWVERCQIFEDTIDSNLTTKYHEPRINVIQFITNNLMEKNVKNPTTLTEFTEEQLKSIIKTSIYEAIDSLLPTVPSNLSRIEENFKPYFDSIHGRFAELYCTLLGKSVYNNSSKNMDEFNAEFRNVIIQSCATSSTIVSLRNFDEETTNISIEEETHEDTTNKKKSTIYSLEELSKRFLVSDTILREVLLKYRIIPNKGKCAIANNILENIKDDINDKIGTLPSFEKYYSIRDFQVIFNESEKNIREAMKILKIGPDEKHGAANLYKKDKNTLSQLQEYYKSI